MQWTQDLCDGPGQGMTTIEGPTIGWRGMDVEVTK